MCATDPTNASVELLLNVKVPILSVKPLPVKPVLKAPPPKTKLELLEKTLLAPRLVIPAAIVVAPEYVLVPEKITLPGPSSVIDPVPVVMAPVTVVVPLPPKKRLAFVPVIAPILKVELASALILTPDVASVMVPPQVFVKFPVPTLRKAPPEEIPVPFSDNASAPTVIPPCTSKAAPDATVTPPAVVPVPCAF